YLPPYSPDFNPIKAFFSDLKAFFRRNYRKEGSDKLSLEEFKKFLFDSTILITDHEKAKAIKGHYRQAGLTFKE
ncbi:hypothetical protein QBC44DRAFT_207871, partial [Cladorrhinum sp. PSN332]